MKVASWGSSHLLSNSSRSLVVRTVCNPIGLSSQTLPPSGRCPTFTVDVYLIIGLPAGECPGPCRSSLVKLFNLQQLPSSDGPRILLAVRAVDHRATGFLIWSFSEPLVGLYGITRPARACVRIYRFWMVKIPLHWEALDAPANSLRRRRDPTRNACRSGVG